MLPALGAWTLTTGPPGKSVSLNKKGRWPREWERTGPSGAGLGWGWPWPGLCLWRPRHSHQSGSRDWLRPSQVGRPRGEKFYQGAKDPHRLGQAGDQPQLSRAAGLTCQSLSGASMVAMCAVFLWGPVIWRLHASVDGQVTAGTCPPSPWAVGPTV